MNFQTLAVRQEKSVLKVTLNNAPINLMSGKMVEELFQVTGYVRQNPQTRVIVLDSANPDFFIAHFDLNDIVAMENDPSKQSRYPDINALQSLGITWQSLPQIKIAKVNGRVRGGGLEFIQAFDMRFASRSSLFCFPEAAGGFLPAGGGTTRTTLLAGPSRALEILLTARDFTGEEAERYGLINRCLEDGKLDAYVDEVVANVALRSPEVVGMIRETMGHVVAPMVEPLFAGFAAENEGTRKGLAGEEMQFMMRGHLEAGQTRENELDLPATMAKLVAKRKR